MNDDDPQDVGGKEPTEVYPTPAPDAAEADASLEPAEPVQTDNTPRPEDGEQDSVDQSPAPIPGSPA